METRGRKPLPNHEKKQAITIYVRPNDIETIGGKAEMKLKLLDYINTLSYVRTNHKQHTQH